MQIKLQYVEKFGSNLVTNQFNRQGTKEDELYDIPEQSEDEPFRVVNGLHDLIIVIHTLKRLLKLQQ